LITENILSWDEEIGWRKNGVFLALGDKKFSDGGQKLIIARQYRKETALRDDEATHKVSYEVEHQRLAQDPDWCKDAEASYMKTNGLAYPKYEDGFTGTKRCFQMLASHELNEFHPATITKIADGTGKVILVYGNKQWSNECGGCFKLSFVVAKGGKPGIIDKHDRAPMELADNNESNKKRVRNLERLVTEQHSEINKLKKVSLALELIIFHVYYVLYIM
jgi:hypothetical protein